VMVIEASVFQKRIGAVAALPEKPGEPPGRTAV